MTTFEPNGIINIKYASGVVRARVIEVDGSWVKVQEISEDYPDGGPVYKAGLRYCFTEGPEPRSALEELARAMWRTPKNQEF